MVMSRASIEELEAELARQDELLNRTTADFNDATASGAAFAVPASFFEELEDACTPRLPAASPFVFGLRV